MLRASPPALVRYAPYSLALQTRFKFRHKDNDPWRRLMDASCFTVDFMTKPRGPELSQSDGHWSHTVTCAHVVFPWLYPNFYPPVGRTKWVSKLSLGECLLQVRQPDLSGEIVHRHFMSLHHCYTHVNPRLDLCVIHSEQSIKRSGEMKMLWLQNEGFSMRPRFEMLEPLQEGDYVWIYGMMAKDNIFEEEGGGEPKMIPMGVKGRVKHLAKEHFFVDTTVDDQNGGHVDMGMCGAAVMRNGKLVGMLTSTVWHESENKELRGTSICTYADDIRKFLLETERQMKNPAPDYYKEKNMFQQRREFEGVQQPEHKDWENDNTRVSKHHPVPQSLWKFDEHWLRDEDYLSQSVFGKSGPFSQEVQEQKMGVGIDGGYDKGKLPDGISVRKADGTKPDEDGMRVDHSPRGIHMSPEQDPWVAKDEFDQSNYKDQYDMMKGQCGDKDVDDMNKLRTSIENYKKKRQYNHFTQTSMNGARPDKGSKLDDPKFQDPQIDPQTVDKLRPKRRPGMMDDDLDDLWGAH